MALTVRVNPVAEAEVDDATSLVERAARAVAADRGVEEGELSLTLLDDEAMTALNRDWLDRNHSTDVLAFALHDAGDPPIGDIYLGVERAAEQAKEQGEPPARELARLAVHGTLHVLGYEHPETERESSAMWQLQERIVAELEVV